MLLELKELVQRDLEITIKAVDVARVHLVNFEYRGDPKATGNIRVAALELLNARGPPTRTLRHKCRNPERSRLHARHSPNTLKQLFPWTHILDCRFEVERSMRGRAELPKKQSSLHLLKAFAPSWIDRRNNQTLVLSRHYCSRQTYSSIARCAHLLWRGIWISFVKW